MSTQVAAPPEADEFALLIYEHLLTNPGVPPPGLADQLSAPPAEVERAVDALRHLGLVRGERPVAVSPEAAQLTLLLPLERAIQDRNRQLAASRQSLRPFETAFDRVQHGRQPAVLRLDADEAEVRLAEAAARCTTEVLAMQSCLAHEPALARGARPLMLELARRGVPVRLLYPHTGRGDTATRSYLCDVLGAGGGVRTTDDIGERFVVFDRTVAFGMEFGGADSRGDSVAVIHEPMVIGLLRRMHEHTWQSAAGFVPARSGYGDALTVLKSSILGLLASGLTDDAIARRVGMSERTLRRHIAAIMRDMAAESRFQAGVAAAMSGLVSGGPQQSLDHTEQESSHGFEPTGDSRRRSGAG
jgi:DNA-binding CsgD family transcriptional regulator